MSSWELHVKYYTLWCLGQNLFFPRVNLWTENICNFHDWVCVPMEVNFWLSLSGNIAIRGRHAWKMNFFLVCKFQFLTIMSLPPWLCRSVSARMRFLLQRVQYLNSLREFVLLMHIIPTKAQDNLQTQKTKTTAEKSPQSVMCTSIEPLAHCQEVKLLPCPHHEIFHELEQVLQSFVINYWQSHWKQHET